MNAEIIELQAVDQAISNESESEIFCLSLDDLDLVGGGNATIGNNL